MPKPTMTGVSTASSAGVANSRCEAAVLLDDGARGASHRPDGQGRKEERDRATDEKPDEDGGMGHVDLGLRLIEQPVDVVPGAPDGGGMHSQLGSDGLDERSEQRHRGNDRRAPGTTST